MELDGFNYAVIGLLDDDEQIKTGESGLTQGGLFRVDAKSSRGVLSASISGLSPQTQTISGSNEVVGISGQGTGSVTLTLSVNDLPAHIEYPLIGAGKDANGAWYQDKDTRSPYSAVELVSQSYSKGDTNNDAVHIALLKGQFFVQPQNLRTNNGTGSINRATDSLQFKAINRHSDSHVISYGFENDSGFRLDGFHRDVFPGVDYDGAITSDVDDNGDTSAESSAK